MLFQRDRPNNIPYLEIKVDNILYDFNRAKTSRLILVMINREKTLANKMTMTNKMTVIRN